MGSRDDSLGSWLLVTERSFRGYRQQGIEASSELGGPKHSRFAQAHGRRPGPQQAAFNGGRLDKVDHILCARNQPGVDDSRRAGCGCSLISLCILGDNIGHETPCESTSEARAMQQRYGWLVGGCHHCRDSLCWFTKASSAPFNMVDVADNTKPRRLTLPRATSQGSPRFGPARDLAAWMACRSLPSSTLDRPPTPETFPFFRATVCASLSSAPRLT